MKRTFTWILLAVLLAATAAAAGGRPEAPDAASLIAKGRQQLGRGEVDAAVQTLVLAREASPADPAVYSALAAAYLKMGAEPMAVMQLQKSIELDSTQVDTRLQLAEIHLHNHRWAEAGRLYREVLRRDPQNDSAGLGLGHLFLKAKQPAAAAQTLEGYVGRHPEDERTAADYLGALEASGRDEPLARAAESVLASRPDWPPALRAAGGARARLGQPEAALAHYQHLEKQQPLAGADAATVGRCLVALKKDDEAVAWFERASRDGAAAVDWAEPAAASMRLQHWSEAASLYERKLAQDSTSVSALVNFALCKQQLQEFEPARKALLRAVALRPDHLAAQYSLAMNYVRMDSTRAARRTYTTVVHLAAANTAEHTDELRQAYHYLCVMDLLDKDWPAAIARLDQALQLDPKSVELRLYRAQAFFAVNRKADAKQDFELVLRMQPGNKEAQKGLNLLAQFN
jgi:tetratricopeptide (TPR) repeat protein